MGHHNEENSPIEFKIVKNSSPIKQIICGAQHTFAICENKKVYCWGYNASNELGLGYNEQIGFNKPIEFKIEGSSIKQIICGAHHTFAICENKKVYFFLFYFLRKILFQNLLLQKKKFFVFKLFLELKFL